MGEVRKPITALHSPVPHCIRQFRLADRGAGCRLVRGKCPSESDMIEQG